MKPALYRNTKMKGTMEPDYFRKLRQFSLPAFCSGKLNVKQLLFAQCLVSVLFLVSSCSDSNRYQKDDLRQVREFIDRRDTEALLTYAENADEEVRFETVLGFCSYCDSSSIAALLKMAEFDESARVRSAAAYALGQFRVYGLYHLLGRLLMHENDQDVALQLAVAVGKSQGDSLLFTMVDDHPEYFKGIFYSVLQKEIKPGYEPLIIQHLQQEKNNGFYAAACLARIKSPSGKTIEGVARIFNEINNDEVLFQLAIFLGKHLAQGHYPENWNNLNEYVKTGFLRGRLNASIPVLENELQKIESEPSHHIHELFAERCMLDSSAISAEALVKLAARSNHVRQSFYYYKAALIHASEEFKNRITEDLAKKYNSNGEEYSKALILDAMLGSENNALFVYEQSFKTESIVVRGYGVEALFNLFRKNPENYRAACLDLIERSLSTRDVALCSHAALALVDTALLPNPDNNTLLPMVENALSAMKLPRDIETYNDLLKARAHLLGKSFTGKLKPEYNHPIDWDLALRIPRRMPVKFETQWGAIEVELFMDEAPASVAAFVQLIQDGFYAKKRVHRVVPGFVVQDGCPRGDGFGSTPHSLRTEIHPDIEFLPGTLGMASAGNDTESCQWFICHGATPHLNGRYTAFGRVTQGMDILFKLGLGDAINNISLLPEKSPF